MSFFYNSACHRKNVLACLARGNKGKSMRSVSKVNTSGDTSVTEVGQYRNNKQVTGQMNAGNIGMDKTSGNVSNCVHNVKLVENQNNVSGRSLLACNHGRDIQQKVGGLNKEGATKQLAPTRLNTSPTVTGPISQDKGSVKDCDTRCEKKDSTLPSHHKEISDPDYMFDKKGVESCHNMCENKDSDMDNNAGHMGEQMALLFDINDSVDCKFVNVNMSKQLDKYLN